MSPFEIIHLCSKFAVHTRCKTTHSTLTFQLKHTGLSGPMSLNPSLQKPTGRRLVRCCHHRGLQRCRTECRTIHRILCQKSQEASLSRLKITSRILRLCSTNRLIDRPPLTPGGFMLRSRFQDAQCSKTIEDSGADLDHGNLPIKVAR